MLDVGDLSYADGYQPRWDSWGRLVEPVHATLPIMHTEGNHEEEARNAEPSCAECQRFIATWAAV